MKIAFYAPIKPPDHHIPSGDRLIARNLISALKLAEHEVKLASSFIAYSKKPDRTILTDRKKQALAEAEHITNQLTGASVDCWITYHPYCKAPDWIGPIVSTRLGIPYVTVEAARTGQGFDNGGDVWRDWRREAQAGIRTADLHLCFKPTDRNYLTELLGRDQKIAMIPPFIDTEFPEKLPDIELPTHWRSDWPVLMTAGMMRPGKKVENYHILAAAVNNLQALQWNLVVAGGGPEEERIRNYFKNIDPSRLYLSLIHI